jgi:hypothetical protein
MLGFVQIKTEFKNQLKMKFKIALKMEKEFSFIPSPSLAFGLLAQPAAPPPCFLSQAQWP